MITDEDLAKALDRIARTADGELLYRYCQKKLMGVLADHAPSDSALRTEHGERRFAAQLMAHMRQGIEDSDGRSDSNTSDGQRTERIVVFAGAKPAVSNRHVNAREHIRASDHEYRSVTSGDGTGR